MNTRRCIFAALLAITSLLTANVYAQDAAKSKPMTFHGKIEAVTDKGLTVNGGKVEGWMDAMTMSYPVDKPDVLKKVRAGDTITATSTKGTSRSTTCRSCRPASRARRNRNDVPGAVLHVAHRFSIVHVST